MDRWRSPQIDGVTHYKKRRRGVSTVETIDRYRLHDLVDGKAFFLKRVAEMNKGSLKAERE